MNSELQAQTDLLLKALGDVHHDLTYIIYLLLIILLFLGMILGVIIKRR